jgi:hypothetical protein
MKSRRVIVTLELSTALPLAALRDRYIWEACLPTEDFVVQVSTNVITAKRPPIPHKKSRTPHT